jgi:hypothetical protein
MRPTRTPRTSGPSVHSEPRAAGSGAARRRTAPHASANRTRPASPPGPAVASCPVAPGCTGECRATRAGCGTAICHRLDPPPARGRVLGRPRRRGTSTVASVSSARVISATFAAFTSKPSGNPLPSVTTPPRGTRLRALAPAGESDFRAPFWPGRSYPPGTRGSHRSSVVRPALAGASAISFPRCRPGPTAPGGARRRQAVPGLPYRAGKSCQRKPLRSTNRMPLSVVRSSALGRPSRWGGGSKGASFSHWASIRSVGTAMPVPPRRASARRSGSFNGRAEF